MLTYQLTTYQYVMDVTPDVKDRVLHNFDDTENMLLAIGIDSKDASCLLRSIAGGSSERLSSASFLCITQTSWWKTLQTIMVLM